MFAILLRRMGLVPGLVLFLLGLGAAHPALAMHLLGGEMTYRYLDAKGPAAAPLRYEITVAIYNNCGAAAIRPSASVGIYNQGTGTRVILTNVNYTVTNTNSAQSGMMSIPQTSLSACVQPAVPPGCTISGVSQPYQLQKFVGIVNLPQTTTGYYALFTDGNRNVDITNLSNPGGQALTLYAALAPPALPNRSPVFSDLAVAIICANDTTYLLNNAVDADGDRLVYSFGQPYGTTDGLGVLPLFTFTPTPPILGYTAGFGYSATTPFGTAAGNFAELDPASGIAKYSSTKVGAKYAVAVDVSEYRTVNGQEVLIGTTRRDLQLVVASCPTTKSPALAPVAVMPRNYTIEAGTSLSVPISATQADGHPLSLTLNSILLDGAGGFDAALNGQVGTVTPGNPTGTATLAGANGLVTGTLTLNTTCNDARTTPYDVALLVKDTGCAGKTVVDVLHITVTKPKGPTAISGDATVCGLNTVRTYVASGGTTGSAAPRLSWRVVGGTIVGSSTGNSVQVNWPTVGTGTVVVRGIAQSGCPTDSVVQRVVVAQPGTLVASGTLSICQGGRTTLSIVGGAAPYTLTGGASPITGSGPFVLSPTQTTTYTITGAALNSTCGATGQVTITVSPLPVADAGAATRSTCAGAPITLGGTAVAGTTYSWSPATGLSSSTSANPTLTPTNSTGAPLTQTYTLTATNPATGCQATSTVAVTVNPLPVAVPGPAVALCSGSAGQLGAAPVAGLTYSWSPATGLSSATSANPTVTLTNSTSAAITQTYTLTTTSAAGCTSTGTVAVTVNPLPVAMPGAAVAYCSGSTVQLGAAPVAGLTYSWSPSMGLTNASAANPSVTLANTTGAPITQTYSLTVTNPATGCASTGTVAVTVNPLPVAVPGAAVAFCSGGSAQLGGAPVAGLTYSWSPATGLSSATSANPTVTLTNTTSAPITQTYTLTTTSATTCANTATVTVTVNPLPVAVPGAAVALCSGSAGQLGAAAVAGLTYSWSPATGLSSATSANPTVTLTNTTGAPLTQTYTLTTTSATNCTSTAAVTVTVNPLPAAVPGAAVALCSGGSAQLGGAPVAGLTYNWSPATGLSNATSANPTVTLTNSTSAAITPTYTLTVTNAATGCTSTGTVTITVRPTVAPGTIGADQTVCLGVAPAPLTSTAAASGGTGTFGYQWQVSPDNGTWTAVAGATSPTYSPGPVATLLYYRRVATDACGTATSNVVTVRSQTPLVSGVALPAPAAQCAGTAMTFTPVPTNAGAAPTYRWFVNNTQVAASPTFTSSTLANGDQVRVELTPAAGFCATNSATATATVSLIPIALPTAAVSVQTALPACAGTPVTFRVNGVTNLGTGTQYQWQVDGVAVGGAQTTSAGTTFTSSTLRDGQVVTLAVLTTTPCGPVRVISNAIPVAINPTPNVEAGPDKTIMEGDQVVLEGSADGPYPVTWTPGLGLTFAGTSNQLRPTAAPAVTTTYTLSAQLGSCTDQSSVTVTVTPRLRIPNALSPNGDGNDDTWQIDNIGAYPANHVLVFNRWGSKIFETSGYRRGNEWNGAISGQPAPVGTYYYVITLGNGKSYSGPLTVVY